MVTSPCIRTHASFQQLALAAIAGLSATMTLASCSSGGGGGDDKVTGKLNGAGASFPAAIYQRWFQELQPEGVTVNYQSVGSGAGVRQFTANTVDFGASDKPCLLYTSPSPRDKCRSRMPSSA